MTTRMAARCTAGDVRELEGQLVQHTDGTGAQAYSTGTAPLQTVRNAPQDGVQRQ